MKLQNDLFVIERSNDMYLVYAPLRKRVFMVDGEAADIVENYIRDEGSIIKYTGSTLYKHIKNLEVQKPSVMAIMNNPLPTKMVVIPTQKCNLACSYCYAEKAHSDETLTLRQLKAAVDYGLSLEEPTTLFSFIGGGDPLYDASIFMDSVTYIKKRAAEKGITAYISVTSNGTLFTEKITQFILDNEVRIGLSFDILKDIQDAQRPFAKSTKSTFDVVDANLKNIMKLGIEIGIRATITNSNLYRMVEALNYVVENYPSIKRLHFEPVTDFTGDTESFYKEFVKEFANLVKKTPKGLSLKNSATNTVERLKTRFCSGEFCVTPTGDIVACHRITSKRDSEFDKVKFGFVKGNITWDEEQYEKVIDYFEVKQPECADCFAKYNCGGGCPMQRAYSEPLAKSGYCYYIQETIAQSLEKMITG